MSPLYLSSSRRGSTEVHLYVFITGKRPPFSDEEILSNEDEVYLFLMDDSLDKPIKQNM